MPNTKKDFQEYLKKIIEPVLPYYTEKKAGIKCGSFGVHYGDDTAKMEGFARILWGLAPFFGGGGEWREFEETYICGIVNGTDPESDEYWGTITDYDQKIVETAALGLGLILAPHKIWNPLTQKQRNNLKIWLEQVNHVNSVDNNWLFFAVLVNLGFKSVGVPYDKDKIKKSLDRVNQFYIGNGWYKDGDTDQIDYYISFAIHFYSLIYAKVMENDDPENSRIFKERAKLFAKDFIYWFTENGEALAFGRSLTYRFAQVSFWSACVFAGVEPVVFAFNNAESGDIMVQKAPACTIEVLAKATKALFDKEDKCPIKVIGIRHGEKMYETLLTNEECAHAIDMGDFYRVPADKRDLNYDKYFKDGDAERNTLTEFNSSNTELLNVEQVKDKLLTLSYINSELEGISNE